MASSLRNQLAVQLVKKTNLKSCKSIKFQFNPWREDTKSIRDFFTSVYSSKIRLTNEKCVVTSDIRSDNSLPQFEVVFHDSSKAIFKTEALTKYDIVKEFNRLCELKAPKEIVE